MIKRCPKNCYVTDKPILRCPRCGELLRNDGNRSKEEVTKEIEKMQIENMKSLGNNPIPKYK
jgi:hypothetical protein